MGIRSLFSSKKSTKPSVAVPTVSSTPATRTSNKVTFKCLAPEAKEVRIAGTFNNWNTQATALEKGTDGKWTVSLDLTPGTHEYRYLVDGQWRSDEQCERKVKNPFGSYNSALEIAKIQ